MRFGLRRAVIVGSSALLLVISGPASSVGAQQALVGPVVQVSPANMAAGNITFHGLVANCMSGQGPSRVAVYDGLDAAAPYVADAAIAPSTDIGAACGGQSGVVGRSFTLILNSRLFFIWFGPNSLAPHAPAAHFPRHYPSLSFFRRDWQTIPSSPPANFRTPHFRCPRLPHVWRGGDCRI